MLLLYTSIPFVISILFIEIKSNIASETLRLVLKKNRRNIAKYSKTKSRNNGGCKKKKKKCENVKKNARPKNRRKTQLIA